MKSSKMSKSKSQSSNAADDANSNIIHGNEADTNDANQGENRNHINISDTGRDVAISNANAFSATQNLNHVADERTNETFVDLEHTEVSNFLEGGFCGEAEGSSATEGEDHEIRMETTEDREIQPTEDDQLRFEHTETSSAVARDCADAMQFSDISRPQTANSAVEEKKTNFDS